MKNRNKKEQSTLKSKEYFNYIVARAESDLKIYSGSSELIKCLYLLNALKNSDNLLKDIYIISRVKNLKNFGNYLLFILKKAETGEIRFENLLENLDTDKNFLTKELLNCFNIGKLPEEVEKKEGTKEKTEGKETKEEKISAEIKRILAESKFKVEEIDNELVTEEFIESNTTEEEYLIVRGNYLELLKPEDGLEESSVYSLPADNGEYETEESVHIEENDVFSLPGEEKGEKIRTEEFDANEINVEEIEEINLEKFGSGKVTGVGEETEEFTGVEEETETSKSTEEETGTAATEETIESESEGTHQSAGEKAKENEEDKLTRNGEEHKEISITEGEERTEEITKTAEAENSVYMKYETELLTSNVLLRSNLEELLRLGQDYETDTDRKNLLIKEVIESSAYMEEYSRKMSFEVITGIYGTMSTTFSIYGRTVGKEIIYLFAESIKLIESLVKGEDFAGYDSTIKSLDVLKQTLIEVKREDGKEEAAREKEGVSGELIKTKEYNINERQKLAVLKQNITDVENVFKSIEDIKGKFQEYEALRRLSHTFTHFKELVGTANALEMKKMAQLAEASYIFVKFIQNYRMDPFESEITEVFKYIIYNFKLLFLEKPTKDIDLLISYLNDPVKIFEKKDKKQ